MTINLPSVCPSVSLSVCLSVCQAGLGGEETSGAQHSQRRLPDPHLIPLLHLQSVPKSVQPPSPPLIQESLPATRVFRRGVTVGGANTDEVDDEHTNIYVTRAFLSVHKLLRRLRQKVSLILILHVGIWMLFLLPRPPTL